jgi:hypothetical protein
MRLSTDTILPAIASEDAFPSLAAMSQLMSGCGRRWGPVCLANWPRLPRDGMIWTWPVRHTYSVATAGPRRWAMRTFRQRDAGLRRKHPNPSRTLCRHTTDTVSTDHMSTFAELTKAHHDDAYQQLLHFDARRRY